MKSVIFICRMLNKIIDISQYTTSFFLNVINANYINPGTYIMIYIEWLVKKCHAQSGLVRKLHSLLAFVRFREKNARLGDSDILWQHINFENQNWIFKYIKFQV